MSINRFKIISDSKKNGEKIPKIGTQGSGYIDKENKDLLRKKVVSHRFIPRGKISGAIEIVKNYLEKLL